MKKSEPKMILNISLNSEEIEEKVKIAMDEYVQKAIYKNLDEEIATQTPTAYDVDKVVEQLKTDSSVRLYGSGNSNNYLISLEKAIEIVKAGKING